MRTAAACFSFHREKQAGRLFPNVFVETGLFFTFKVNWHLPGIVIMAFGIEIVHFAIDSLRVDPIFEDLFRLLLFCLGAAVL